MKPFWKSSPWHDRYRRVQRLGSHAKWTRENPDEAAKVKARHEKEKADQ